MLLDTHVWLWWLLGSKQLPKAERAALDRLASRGGTRLAAVSLWEAQMLHAKGRLATDRPFDEVYAEATRERLEALRLRHLATAAMNISQEPELTSAQHKVATEFRDQALDLAGRLEEHARSALDRP